MKKSTLVFAVLSLLFISCNPGTSSQYIYQPPEDINDGLNTGHLDEVNIDKKLITRAVDKIQGNKFKEVHSMLIFKDNKLVLEKYFKGHQYQWDASKHHGELVAWERDMLHDIMSVTKSITSVCIGIAVDHGFIESVHQSIFDYLPEHRHLGTGGKDKITIEHLLTMTSGLKWSEWSAPYSSQANDAVALWLPPCHDPIACVLEKPLINEPGKSFTYSGGGTIVLGEIIKNATKMDIDAFSKKYLFQPLGIDNFSWGLKFENDVIEAAGGLKITPRDMVKIGAVFLNMGTWNGKRIVSGQWVDKSATPFPGNHGINIPGEDSGRNGYSYSWWTKTFKPGMGGIPMYAASGWGGQHIMVFPGLNTVVVFTGGNYVTRRPPFKIIRRYVLPAVN